MELKDIALAYWRLERWVNSAAVERKAAAISSLRRIKEYLDKSGIEIIDFIGQPYDIGLSVDVISKDTDAGVPDEDLIISETLKPLILKNGEIAEYGQVILGTSVKQPSVNNTIPDKQPRAADKKTNKNRNIIKITRIPGKTGKHRIKRCIIAAAMSAAAALLLFYGGKS